VVTEDDRVLRAVQAMRNGDLALLGKLFYESHASMRDDYQVSVKEIDLLVELARQRPEVYGTRLTGGGFGGSVVMLARAGTGADVAQRIAASYAERSGRTPTVLVPA
jgi:galactokinase